MATGGVEGCLAEDVALAYFQGQVDELERAGVEAHMDSCDECRWLVSELARANGERPAVRSHPQVGRYLIGERLGSGGMGVVYAAYDPELERRVAVKLVRPGSGEGSRTRLQSEARTMARLSHPGVVPIYDVSNVGSDVVLAMELVEGEDARRWLLRRRPSWRQAVAVLLPAGRGLAAAHAAGIVHRDVKPANLLIGRDGRARITDFGLARAIPIDGVVTGAARRGDVTGALTTAVTRPGALAGTPAYMAPEQFLGRPASPCSDQFSFSVVLYEAIYGERPFGSPVEPGFAGPAQLNNLIAEVTSGRVRPPAPGSRAPAWLRRALVRGLAVDPDDRWPSLAAMLDRIEETPRRHRAISLVIAAGALLLVMAGVVIAAHTPLPSSDCTGAPAALEQAFATTEWTTARARITGLGAYADAAGQQIDQALDRFRTRWTTGYRDACLVHRSGAQSDALLGLRMACLERDRAALAAAADIVRTATANTLADTVAAARALPDPIACSDVESLAVTAPSPPPHLAARVAATGSAIARVDVKRNAGRLTEARNEAKAAVAQARAVGYPPVLARALLAEGRAAMAGDDRALAAPGLAEAMRLAIESGDIALAVEAWARAAYVKGTGDQTADALAGHEIIEAMARRLRTPSFARALLENNVGVVELARGHRREASDRFQRALAEAREITGPDTLELVNIRSNAATVIDDPVRRDGLLAEAEAELGRWLGAEHPETLRLRTRRGMLSFGLVTARDLLGSACATYEQFHQAEAATLTTSCWAELGYIFEELGDRAGALAALARALRLPGDTGHMSREPAGNLLLFRGDARGASTQFETALVDVPRSADAPWWRALERGELEVGLGRARLIARDPAGALVALDQAVDDLSSVAKSHPSGVVIRRLARAHAARAEALRATGASAARVSAATALAVTLLREEGAPEPILVPRDIALRSGQGGLADRP